MEIGATRKGRNKRTKIRLEGDRDASRYPHSLQLFSLPPTENISLQEFEEFAVERLKVLKVFETVGIRHLRGSNEYTKAVTDELKNLAKQNIFKGVIKTKQTTESAAKAADDEDVMKDEDYDGRRKDHISHFILRLAYCRSEELRRWFIQQEMDMFRYRFSMENDQDLQKFLDLNNLNYKPIPDSEKKSVLRELLDSSSQISANKIDLLSYYKVPFTDVLDLVRQRRIYLRGGSAFVPHSDLVLIILSHFRSSLSHALAVTQRALPHLEEDDRLIPLLTNLSKRYLGQDYSNKKHAAGVITADMIDGLSKTSFPMCMSHLHQSLRTHHHMRHWGRQQYGLFLKAIGLSLEEAMRFWRTEFTKTCDVDKFDKQYAYNIRHNYGKEGKRTDYTPYSCIKIITTNSPATGDHHGCPFKHSDLDLLKQKMQGMRVSKDAIDEIGELVKRHHYQIACGKYFEFTHNISFGFSPNHPNHYFEESQKILNGGVKPEAPTPNRGTPVIRPISHSQTPLSGFKKPKMAPDDEFDDFPMSAADLDLAMQGVEEAA